MDADLTDVAADRLGDGRQDRTGGVTIARRASIVEAAIDVFASRGYAGASTREIAQAAHLKQGHLYYYFRSKDDLLFEIVDDLHDAFLAGPDEWVAALSGEDAVRSFVRAHVALVCARNRQTMVAYESWRFLTDERRMVISGKRRSYEHRFAQVVRSLGPGHGEAVDVKSVLGLMNWAYQWYDPTGEATPTALGERLADLAIGALRVTGRTPDRSETQ